MKTKFIAGFIAAATIITILSCNWFKSKSEKKETANPLIGKWQLDSVKIGKDSSLAYFLFQAEKKESSAGFHITFIKDTLLSSSDGELDTAFYSFDEKQKRLTVKDSIPYVYTFEKISDSLISLTATKDSSVLYLKKE